MYSLPASGWPNGGPSQSLQLFPGHAPGVQDFLVNSWTQGCLVKSWTSPQIQDCLVKSWTTSQFQEIGLKAAFQEKKWCPPERARELSDKLLLAQDVVQVSRFPLAHTMTMERHMTKYSTFRMYDATFGMYDAT